MVGKPKIVCLLVLLCASFSYSQQLRSYITTNHTEAYIGQPVQMTVSVYTSTWFTSGVDVGNIQVEGALTVYFRSVSNSKTIGGQQYSGVDFIYNIFPTQEGIITIPELEIHIESPKKGGYKGIKHVLHTKPKTISVSGIPVGYSQKNWLVSSTLNIRQDWNTSIKNVKVGDVLQRTISRSASGTLGEFIPAIAWDSIAGVSIYPKRPGVNTRKTKTYVSASRTDAANYLFEKEGEVTLPRIEFMYWNYGNRKFYKKIIDSITINVAPNPDLSMLASVKKQLEAESVAEVKKDKPFTILGMAPKQFLLVFLISIVAIYIFIKLAKWLYLFMKNRYKGYLNSEKYYFSKVSKALKQKDANTFVNNLSIWMLHLNMSETNFDYFLNTYGTEELKHEYDNLKNRLFNSEENHINFNLLLSALKASRKNYLRKSVKSERKLYSDWLNPT